MGLIQRLGQLLRRRAAPASAEPDGLYRSLVDNSMDAVLLTAPDGRIVMANGAAAALFGYTEDELCALGRAAIVDPSDPRLGPALEARRRTGSFRGELTMRRKDGTRLEVELSSAIFRGRDGAEWTSMFIRDISDRRAREAERDRLLDAVDAERRWLRAVLEHVPVSVILFEPDGRLSFNRKAEETIGITLSPEGGSAQYRDRILFPDGSPVPPDQLVSTRVLESGERVTAAEFLVERPDGSRVPILGSAGPIRDREGRIVGAIGVFQDISERMGAEKAIRANERLLNAIFELLPVGVWIADPSGRIVRGNPAGIRIWGGARYVGPADFGEYKAWWAESGQRIEADEWALARAIHRREASIGEVLRIQCFDGTFKTIINSALPLYDDQGRPAGAIVVNEDITPLKETEAALRRALESRKRVLEVVAHDLRQPLQVILALAQVLRIRVDSGQDDGQTLQDIRSQVERMDRLIQDLLEASQLESGVVRLHPVPVAADELVHDACRLHDGVVSAASLVLQCAVEPELQTVRADREKVARVFGNLIDNAIKFTPAGGRITLGAARGDGEVRFWVADTGAGIPPESVPQVFARGFQATRERGGLGLGLDIVKAIVDAHGGRIWVDSAVGQGTSVAFTLPSEGRSPSAVG
jgi:PAS domain S-box-containing protein